MMTTRDTSAIAEQTPWGDDPRTAPSRRTDAPRTAEPGDDRSNPASVHGIVGGSLTLRRVLRLVESVATTDAAVLIRGETGTGKELIGGVIHTLSTRRTRPFVKFNCTAIPAGLLECERVGSAHTIRSDVRVIGATNRPLEELVAAGEFRADLYYRLNVFPIDLPALRERPEDIPLLVRHF